VSKMMTRFRGSRAATSGCPVDSLTGSCSLL
jgi:hypothetical protein